MGGHALVKVLKLDIVHFSFDLFLISGLELKQLTVFDTTSAFQNNHGYNQSSAKCGSLVIRWEAAVQGVSSMFVGELIFLLNLISITSLTLSEQNNILEAIIVP